MLAWNRRCCYYVCVLYQQDVLFCRSNQKELRTGVVGS